jgi:hypothetical protein
MIVQEAARVLIEASSDGKEGSAPGLLRKGL